jgi:hypothetical protein
LKGPLPPFAPPPPPPTVHHVTCNRMHNISLFSFTSSFRFVEVWLKVHELNGSYFFTFRCLFGMQYELLVFAGSDLLLPLSFVTRVSILGLATTFFGPNNMLFFCFELFSLLCFRFKNERILNLCLSIRSGIFHWHLVCVTLRASYTQNGSRLLLSYDVTS